MEDEELERLLTDLESDRVERKASISDKGKICQAICAFANDLPNHRRPGVLFIGCNDDGSCADLDVTDRLLLDLADLKSNGNILPFPSLVVQKRRVSGCDLAVVLVHPSDAPPVRFNGRVWIRVGPRRSAATPDEERRLAERRRSRDLPFDIRPVGAAAIEDLDLELFRKDHLPALVAPDVLEENERSTEQQLAALRFLASDPAVTPTVLGVLCLAWDSRRFLPGAYVQFVKFDGAELTTEIADQKVIDGPLRDQLLQLDQLIQAHILVASDIAAGPVEVRHPDYPVVALQQLVRNAVCHRTYEGTNAPVRIHWFSDRIEILSPGGPYGQVNVENFGEPGITDYRNPNIAAIMRSLGFIQRFGIGIALARSALENNGNPSLEFQVRDSNVLAVIRR